MKTIVEGHATAGEATRTRRGWQLALLGCLLAALLAGVPAIAAAATPEMRGEWELVMKSGPNTLRGKTIIRQEANAKEEFSSPDVTFEVGAKGTFSGTLEGSKASVLVTIEGLGPVPPSRFESTEMTVNPSATPTISGSGTLTFEGQPPSSATLTATRIKTYLQVEEQEAIEKREAEEREERKNVRGEWELVMSAGPMTVKGTARITTSADASNKFASSSALFEGSVAGTFSGTLGLTEATVEVTSEAFGGTSFTSSEMAVAYSASSMSMSGNGTLKAGAYEGPASLTATRIKTYAQLVEVEAQEKRAAEAKEREAREAQEKVEREAREKREQEAAATQTTGSGPTTTGASGGQTGAASILSAQLTTLKLGVSGSGSLSLQLANPNALPVHGRVTLLLSPSSGKKARARSKAKSVVLGASSFTISASGNTQAAVRLSKAGRALLAHHKTLRVVAKVRTEASGAPATSKTWLVTLRAASHGHAHH